MIHYVRIAFAHLMLWNSVPPSFSNFSMKGLSPAQVNSIFRASIAFVTVIVRFDFSLSAYFLGACRFVATVLIDSPAWTHARAPCQ